MKQVTEQYEKALDEWAKWEDQVNNHNKQLLSEIGAPADEVEEIIVDCDVTGKMEIVETAKGEDLKEQYGFFTSVYADQLCTGVEGDSFAGSIYAKFAEGRWLKIPYEC